MQTERTSTALQPEKLSHTGIETFERMQAEQRRPAAAAAHKESYEHPTPKNLGSGMRLACLAGGTSLVGYGAKRRGISGTLMALFGAELIYHGASGRSALLKWTGLGTQPSRNVTAERTVTVNRPVSELYAFWKDPANMPKVMEEIESVTVKGENQWHWRTKPMAGIELEWDSELVQEIPDRVLSWKAVQGSTLPNAGTLVFTPAPGNRGTEVKLRFQYEPPGGEVGNAIASLFGKDAYHMISRHLRRFEQLIETGEIARTDGQPAGERSLMGKAAVAS